jgi:hypothetical protein
MKISSWVRLAAIATVGGLTGGCFFVPNLANQAEKARIAEAAIMIQSLNRAQQATLLENDSFAATIEALGIPLPSTSSYTYGLSADGEKSLITAIPTEPELPSVIGAVYVIDAEAATMTAIVCQSDGNAEVAPAPPVLTGETLTCAPGSTDISAN